MHGYPNHLNTRYDVDYVVGNFPEEARADIQRMLDARWIWQTTGDAGGGGVIDDSHRVVEEKDESGATKLLQQELVEDPNCQLFRLGLTVAEAEAMVGP